MSEGSERPAKESRPLTDGLVVNIGDAPQIDLTNNKKKNVYNEDKKLPYKKGTRIIFNHRWYYALIPETDRMDMNGKPSFKDTPALYIDHPKSTLRDKFMVCLNVQGNVKVNKLFSFFDTFGQLLKYHTYFKTEYLSFFEVIIADRPKKMYFDLDPTDKYFGINLRPVLDNLLYAVYTVFSEMGILLKLDRDILIYCSHETLYPEHCRYIHNMWSGGQRGIMESKAFM